MLPTPFNSAIIFYFYAVIMLIYLFYTLKVLRQMPFYFLINTHANAPGNAI